MSAVFDIGPLTWVKGEIDASLERALAALRAYGANLADSAQLGACRSQLHQASGAVQIVGLEGASRYFEQTENLLADLESGAVESEHGVLDLLERAIGAIGKYLSELIDGEPDQPLRLYPEYRQLAEARKAPPPTEAELFFPDLALPPPPREKPARRLLQDGVDAFLRAQRTSFQRGFVRWLREPSDIAAIADMRAAVDEVESTQTAGIQRSFWWASGAFFDALACGDLAVETGVKQLAGRIEQQLRRMSSESVTVPDRLLREVLYWIARAGDTSAKVRAVKEAYKLAGALPARHAPAPSPQRASAALALREAIASAKDAWTRFAAGAESAHGAFAQHAANIVAQARLLEDADLAKLGDAIGRIASEISANPANLSEAAAMEVATALLVLENAAAHLERTPPDLARQVQVVLDRLAAIVFAEPVEGPLPTTGLVDEMTRRAQERLATGAALLAIQANLKQIEVVLDAYFRNPLSAEDLASIDPIVHQVSGALRVLGEEDAREALERCAAKIRGFAMTGARPETGDFEEVAEVLSGLSFYLDALRHGKADFATAMRPIGERQAVRGEQDEAGTAGAHAAAPEPSQTVPILRVAPVPGVAGGTGSEPETIDQELLVIFLEEAHGVLESLGASLAASHAQPASTPELTTIRRNFHTLKGSGRMVGLMRLGEAAWAVEQVMNLWLQEERSATPELLELIEQARRLFADWVAQLENNEPQPEPEALIAAAEQLRRGERPTPAPAEEVPAEAIVEAVPEEPELIAEAAPAGDEASEAIIEAVPEQPEQITEAAPALAEHGELAVEAAPPAEAVEATTIWVGDVGISSSLFAVFVREASQFLEALERELAAAATSGRASEELVRSAHTFGGICGTVQIAPMHDLGHALEAALLRIRKRDTGPQGTELRLLAYCIGALRAMYTDVCAHRLPRAREELVAALDGIAVEQALETAGEGGPLPDVGAETLQAQASGVTAAEEDVQDLAFSIEELAAATRGESQERPPPSDEAQSEALATGETEETALSSEAEGNDLTFTLEERGTEEPSTGEEDETSRAAPEAVVEDSDQAQSLIEPRSLEELTRALEGLEGVRPSGETGEGGPQTSLEESEYRAPAGEVERLAPETESLEDLNFSLEGLEGLTPPAASPGDLVAPDVLSELSEVAAPAEGETRSGPKADSQPEVVAEPEVPVERRQRRIEDDLDPQLLPVFAGEAQELTPQIGEMLRAWRREPDNWDLAGALQRLLHTFKGGARMAGVMSIGELTHHMETRVESAVELKNALPPFFDELEASFDRIGVLLERLEHPGEAPPEAEGAEPGEAQAPRATTVREAVPTRAVLRVQAETLEKLVNRAGEVAIARSRIETEARVLKDALTDLTDNVARLRGQLREIEIQAESQMQARAREVEEKSGTFDPLEFDRFTRFQELTRMMAESVNDVSTLYQTIARAVDGTESALSAQARLNRELQQDLMRVRMVPVNSIADRLHRVVRQTAKELEKRANLDILGGNVELDRSVLERMTGPLEHLLRNAVTHGIEPPAGRLESGKPEFGEIRLDARQEGNEVVLAISDDGAGLDLEGIRAQAVERGLMTPDEQMEDRYLGDLIFLPGFSTAEAVTQIAGRGVGMDVVREEVRAIGGRIEVESSTGEGVTFTIRLPLTTAVTQTVLVKSGSRICALPAVMVEQVRQLRPEQLERTRAQGRVDWAGRSYPFAYLPDLLEEPGAPSEEAKRRAPVVLARLGAETVALLVDGIHGNQEVVVKHLGPQLARVPGVAGATVLGTGEVVLILNPMPLLKRPRAEGFVPVAPSEAPRSLRPTVMVVDDSLTVRKITGRLLVREGYDVITAKDGVEALELLGDSVPDAMLVDIEMPRMDGFDLTRNVRADPRLRHVPIIMITSRTAEKHRAYAVEVGVDVFLGKPYREDELLAHVSRLVGREASAS